MPEWPLALLFLLVFGGVNYLAYRCGHVRGYDAGTADSQRINRWSDEIMKGNGRG